MKSRTWFYRSMAKSLIKKDKRGFTWTGLISGRKKNQSWGGEEWEIQNDDAWNHRPLDLQVAARKAPIFGGTAYVQGLGSIFKMNSPSVCVEYCVMKELQSIYHTGKSTCLTSPWSLDGAYFWGNLVVSFSMTLKANLSSIKNLYPRSWGFFQLRQTWVTVF